MLRFNSCISTYTVLHLKRISVILLTTVPITASASPRAICPKGYISHPPVETQRITYEVSEKKDLSSLEACEYKGEYTDNRFQCGSKMLSFRDASGEVYMISTNSNIRVRYEYTKKDELEKSVKCYKDTRLGGDAICAEFRSNVYTLSLASSDTQYIGIPEQFYVRRKYRALYNCLQPKF